jgi:hypothetical protein
MASCIAFSNKYVIASFKEIITMHAGLFRSSSMKKLLISSVIISLTMTTASFAQQYYVISSDSNNCKVHWQPNKKNYVYVSGSDCLCAQKSSQAVPEEWDIQIGSRKLPDGCYPKLDVSYQQKAGHIKHPVDCEKGDHCTQYQCLKLYFDDNTEYSVNSMTVNENQCININKNPLGSCDQNGDNCH